MSSLLSFFYPDDSETFPSQGKITIILTYILTALGSGIGVFLLIISRGASYFPEGEIDDLPDFDPLFKLAGTILLVLAILSFGVNFLFVNRKKVGWFLLLGLYSAGSVLTIYVLYLGFRVLIENRFFALPYPLLLLLVVGIVGIYSLLHKNTLGLFFPQILSKTE